MSDYSPLDDLRQWHAAVGETRFIELDDAEQRRLLIRRGRLIEEEAFEVLTEIRNALAGSGDLRALAKELADLLYVVYGTADVLDIPLQRVFTAVHSNNMTKVGSDGTVLRREDGKVLKPEGYEPLDVASIF